MNKDKYRMDAVDMKTATFEDAMELQLNAEKVRFEEAKQKGIEWSPLPIRLWDFMDQHMSDLYWLSAFREHHPDIRGMNHEITDVQQRLRKLGLTVTLEGIAILSLALSKLLA